MKSFSQYEEKDWSRARKRETASRHKSSDARKKAYTGLFRKVSGRTPTPGEVKASGANKGGSDYDQKNRELRRKLELTKKLNKGYENMRKGKKNPKPYPYGEEIDEGYTKQSVKNMSTQDLGTFYRYAKFGNGAKRIEQGGDAGAMIKNARDLMGAELGKRARAGEDDAKRHLNNRFSNQMDKYGKKKPQKITPIKKTLSQKIMRMLKGKMK